MSTETDYGWSILRAGVPGRDWVTAWMDLDKFHRDSVRHNKFMYGSPYRPLPQRFLDENPNAVVAHIRPHGRDESGEYVEDFRGSRSLVLTKEPLDHQVLYRYELIPVSHEAIGWYILELANAEKQPVEMTSDGTKAVLLFRNPRRLWQVSYFDERGPSGHTEGENPGTLIADAYREGYRTWAPGMVDAMAESFEGWRRQGARGVR